MQNQFSILQTAALLGLVLSFFITRMLIEAGLTDIPDEKRKLHKAVTATAGGIAIIAGFSGAMVFLVTQWDLADKTLITKFMTISILGAGIGLLDDVFTMGAKPRLLALIATCIFAIISGFIANNLDFGFGLKLSLPYLLAGVLSVIWLLLIVNITNFMDGANGLSLGSLSIAFIFLAILFYWHKDYTANSMALILTAAGFGFLTFNVAKGNIFAGDVGSYFYGLSYGILGLWAVKNGISPFLVGICALPILGDGILTIFHRIRIGENILKPHRMHIYQLLISNGNSHIKTSSIYWFCAIICGIIAVSIDRFAPQFAAIAFISMVLLVSIWLHFARKSINAIDHKIHERD